MTYKSEIVEYLKEKDERIEELEDLLAYTFNNLEAWVRHGQAPGYARTLKAREWYGNLMNGSRKSEYFEYKKPLVIDNSPHAYSECTVVCPNGSRIPYGMVMIPEGDPYA